MHMLMWFQTRIKSSSRDAAKMSHTHERIETKKKKLVYKSSKSHGKVYHSHIKLRKGISYASIGAKKSNGVALLLIKSKVNTRYIHKNLQKEFYIIGEVIKKIFKLMQANVSSNINKEVFTIQPTHIIIT